MLYKKSNSYVERKARSARLLKQYPDNFPVIIEADPYSTQTQMTHKCLVHNALTIANIQQILRKKLKLNEYQAIYICTGQTILSGTLTIEYVYNHYKSDDDFLYLTYCNENSFGGSQS